jgi:hypothetical protein
MQKSGILFHSECPKVNLIASGQQSQLAARGPVADRGWRRRFDDPITPQLLTLRNAALYITELPRPSTTPENGRRLTAEELERIKQVMRDWFRVVAP